MTKYFLDGDDMIIMEEGEIRIAPLVLTIDVDAEIEEEEEEVIQKEVKTKEKKKGNRGRKPGVKKCTHCGGFAIHGKNCPSANGSPIPIGKKLTKEEERDMADRIRELWAEEMKSPIDVCRELKIPMSSFNEIIIEHNIFRNQNE